VRLKKWLKKRGKDSISFDLLESGQSKITVRMDSTIISGIHPNIKRYCDCEVSSGADVPVVSWG
jgi:hypothetical protein